MLRVEDDVVVADVQQLLDTPDHRLRASDEESVPGQLLEGQVEPVSFGKLLVLSLVLVDLVPVFKVGPAGGKGLLVRLRNEGVFEDCYVLRRRGAEDSATASLYTAICSLRVPLCAWGLAKSTAPSLAARRIAG